MMRTARTLAAALASVAVATASAPVAPAYAIESLQHASATVKPSVAGTKARPRAVSLTVRAWFDEIAPDLGRQVQFATVNGEIFFPKEGITNNRRFPSCRPATVLQDERKCPSGSRIGTGSARGIGLGLDETVDLQAFNLPAGKGVVVLVVGETPLIIRDVVVATLTTLKRDPKFRYRLSFTIPRNLQSPAPGVLAAIKDFRLTVPAQYLKKNGRYVERKGRRIPYIATIGCAAGRWQGRYVAEYTTSFDGAVDGSQTVDVSVPCQGTRTKSAKVRGATISLRVPTGCAKPGGRVKVSLTWKRRARNFVRVTKAYFYVGSKRVKTDRRAPFTQTLRIPVGAKPGSTIKLGTRAFTKVKRGKAPRKSIATNLKVCE